MGITCFPLSSSRFSLDHNSNYSSPYFRFLFFITAMTTVVEINVDELRESLPAVRIIDDQNPSEGHRVGCGNHSEVCAICLNKIVLQETALVKGCEHAYCVTCILQWATYKEKPTCPQCKHPFEFLNIHRSLDGSIHDYMFEESVCLLLRASWFQPLIVEEHESTYDELEEYYHYYQYEDEDDDDLDDVYFSGSSSLRIGNRRWGDNGYVRGGRQEARPVNRANNQGSGAAGSSREPKKKESVKDTTGRRAKRALKREAADKAAAVKHQEHLARLGRN